MSDGILLIFAILAFSSILWYGVYKSYEKKIEENLGKDDEKKEIEE